GAGASYASGDCRPKCPPLGAKLFDELRKMGGLAASLPSELAAQFRDRARGFEAGMEAFARVRGAELVAFVKEMALYFVQFGPGTSNLYLELLRGLGTAAPGAVFASLNYELL